MPTKIPWTANCDICRLTLHSSRLRQCRIRGSGGGGRRSPKKFFSVKVLNETSFKMDNILICTRFFVSKGTFFAVSNLQRDSTPRRTHISSVNKANPEKIRTTIWIFWISMTHMYIYVIHRLGGPYWEKLCPRSWVPPETVGRGRYSDRGHSFSKYWPTQAGE